MDRRRLLALAGGAILSLVLVFVATAGEVPLAERSPTFPWTFERGGSDATETQSAEPALTGVTEIEATDPGDLDLPDAVAAGLQLIAAACGIAVLVAVWRRRPRLRWRTAHAPDDFAVLDDVAAMMTADASAQRELLLAGAPRNAIVACWLRLEALISAAGFERNPADTATEFTARVLARFAIDRESIDGLASLYREARFSSHVMGEGQRSDAIRCLDAIHLGLRNVDAAAVS